MLVKIGEKDITRNIIYESYEVDSQDVAEEWEDANYFKHVDVIRTKVAGTFKVMCSKALGMTTRQFIDLINENKTDGTIYAIVYVNNTARLEAINAICKVETGKHLYNADVFSVSLEEC